MTPETAFRAAPFEPTEDSYEALSALLNRVNPDQPTCAAWLSRDDRDRDPAAPFGRDVVTDGDDPARLAAVVEWRRPRWSVEESRFELSVEVDPAHRQRGLGSMLLARALAMVPASRPVVVEIWTREDRPDAVRFLERRGFRLASRHAISELDLARFDPAGFEPEVRRVGASGVTLRHLGDGRCADVGFLRRLYDLQATVQRDAPFHGGDSLPAFDAWRRSYHDNPDLLPEAHGVAEDGSRVVGMTQLWASQATDAILYTGFTGVARSHRRRGLATALKVLSLGWARGRRAASGRPPVVRTGNAETNPMLGINVRLGFTGRPASLRFALERAPGSAGG
jgi:GNAT superfamily N-acetyltransferase